jgi:hypothetical protein
MTTKTPIKRLVNWQDWTVDKVVGSLQSEDEISYEVIDSKIELEMALPVSKNTRRDANTETDLAIAIHQLLQPVRKTRTDLLKDNGFWMWICLEICREQIVNRWCGGFTSSGSVRLPEKASYFLSGDSLVKQSRNGARRLWIAAEISQRCDGDYRHTLGLLASTDLFTGITERMVGLDAEMAVELMIQLSAIKGPVNGVRVEDFRRLVLRKVTVVLSTVAIELLNRSQKAALVNLVISELSDSTNLENANSEVD